jgi:hypothetical protein
VALDTETLEQAGALLDESIATHAARNLKSLDFLQQVCGRSSADNQPLQ